MATQKDIAQALNNAGNAQKLNDLVDDIREAVMDYQVCTPEDWLFVSNVILRHPYNMIPTKAPIG